MVSNMGRGATVAEPYLLCLTQPLVATLYVKIPLRSVEDPAFSIYTRTPLLLHHVNFQKFLIRITLDIRIVSPRPFPAGVVSITWRVIRMDFSPNSSLTA